MYLSIYTSQGAGVNVRLSCLQIPYLLIRLSLCLLARRRQVKLSNLWFSKISIKTKFVDEDVGESTQRGLKKLREDRNLGWEFRPLKFLNTRFLEVRGEIIIIWYGLSFMVKDTARVLDPLFNSTLSQGWDQKTQTHRERSSSPYSAVVLWVSVCTLHTHTHTRGLSLKGLTALLFDVSGRRRSVIKCVYAGSESVFDFLFFSSLPLATSTSCYF